MKNLEANRRLAGLLGWTNIIEVAGALLGTPPAGAPECRGQAKVPDWAGDWRDCGKLVEKHGIDFKASHAPHRETYFAVVDSFGLGEFANTELLAIVGALCAKLEADQ
jgi:hypothetical protein